MLIRQLEEKDNAVLAAMIRKTFLEHDAPQQGTVYSDPTTDDLFALFTAPRSVLWVAEGENGVIGCSGIFPTPGLAENCAELVKVYLDKDARGTGTGKQLMQKSIESALEMGYTELYLESLSEFSRAVGIYEKLGFTRLDRPLINSEHISCNIWMIKHL